MRRALAALCAAALLAVSVRADDQARAPAPPQRRAIEAEFLAAFRARDDAAMTRLVGEMNRHQHIEPFVVADRYFLEHARAVLANCAEQEDLHDAAREVARRSAHRPRNARLPELVETWWRADETAMRRRVALADAGQRATLAINAHNASAAGADPAPLVALAGDIDDVGAVQVLWSAASLTSQYRTPKEALAAWAAVAERARRAGWPLGQASSMWQAGMTAYKAGESETARTLWREQVALLESLDDRAEAANSLLFVADAEERLGRYGEAAALSERAFALAEEQRDGFVAAQALTQAASALVLSGDCAGALLRLDDARRRFDCDCDSLIGSAWTHAVTGRAYASLGLLPEAITSFEAAIALNDKLPKYRTTSSRYRSELAQVLADAGMPERAVELQRRALDDAADAGDPVEAAAARVRLGRALARCGKAGDAAPLIEEALADLDARNVRGAAASARAELARTRAACGRTAEALGLAGRALAEMEAVGDRIGAAHVLRDMASWERARGRPAEALRLASLALETPLALGMGLGDDEGAGLRRDARAAADAGLLAIAEIAPDAEPTRRESLVSEAFRLVESSRGLALAEGILNRDALFDAASAAASRDADASARDRVAATRNRLADLAKEPGADAAALAAARADLDAAYRALAESAARVQREARRVADLVYPRPVGLAEVQRALSHDTALVVFHLTAERAFALAVTHDTARLADLGPAAAIEDAARAYAGVVSVPDSDDVRKAAALYDLVLRPLELETASRRRVVVSPDGALAFVPFDALVCTDGAEPERVIERWEVACVPSATVRHLLAHGTSATANKDEGVVALGDPDYGDATPTRGPALRAYGRLRRLPGTADEVRAIAEVAGPGRCTTLLGERATALDLANAIADRGGRLAALHIACHGHVDTERPRLTGLVLSKGEVLTADDVLRMRIQADVVVLSACSTGKAPVLRGEGVMGLARAFLFAGASRVVVSNWAVSDDAAARLMSAFAGRLLRDGQPAREALRGAKLELLRCGGPLAHPSAWGAFAIWGD